MKVLVCGGRDYADEIFLFIALDSIHKEIPITTLIHGAARGADTMAASWAWSRKIKVIAYPADWEHNGSSAGPLRNQKMLDENKDLDLVIAFPGGVGTRDMINRAEKDGIKVIYIDDINKIPFNIDEEPYNWLKDIRKMKEEKFSEQ